MKKGLLSLVLIALLSLFVVIGVTNTKAESLGEGRKLFIGYKNITTISNLNYALLDDLKGYLALSSSTPRQNYSYQALIVWIDGEDVKQYTFYDMVDIFYTEYQPSGATHQVYNIQFTFFNQTQYTLTTTPKFIIRLEYRRYSNPNNSTYSFYYHSSTNLDTLHNDKLIGFYLADNWNDDRVLTKLNQTLQNNTYDYTYLEDIYEDSYNSASIDLQFLLADYDNLSSLYGSYMDIIETQNQRYYDLEIQYQNLLSILDTYNSEQRNADTFFTNLFNNFRALFSVQILPGFTILTFVAIPLMLSLLALCIHILKG